MDHPNIQTKLPPELIPKPTYWPFMLAVSLLFMGWGVISYWIISLAGTLGFFIALRGWIKEIIDEG
ncbi:MAG: hypothetical protein ACXVBP_14595 [Flavisolibacter sp.]